MQNVETISLLSAEAVVDSANSSPSILDRKRELKSIPGSFSYNLGRRDSGSPPRLDATRTNAKTSNRSVKSIVAWLESSAANETPASTETGATGAYQLRNTVEESPTRPQKQKMIVNIDSDGPAFLDYQKYFTQTSLARCLDETPRAATTSLYPLAEVTRVHSQEAASDKSPGSSRGELFENEKRTVAEVDAL